jgi:hypothetical protein
MRISNLINNYFNIELLLSGVEPDTSEFFAIFRKTNKFSAFAPNLFVLLHF